MDNNKKRLAKNTLLLYVRTLFTLCISLYTSRVVLDVLGVEDYGIYTVVGGLVVMFNVITSSLTTAINRYLTFELGRKDISRLSRIFSTSVSIQLIFSIIVIVIGETAGYWFLNYHMVIPPERLYAANWVLHCTILSFVFNLISIPYNASIIAHEHMDAFAYISILESVLKLVIVFLLLCSPIDILIYYAILQVLVAGVIRLIYGIYCKKKFVECRYKPILDKELFKEMSNLAGWSFFSNAFYIFNTQGVNILVNLYFGVAVNAARGIATQVEGAIMSFVKNFIIAINPQITKAYAEGNKSYLNQLIVYGAKYTFYMSMAFVIPFILETEYVMGLWLKQVPEYAVLFVQLSFIYSVIDSVGNTGYYACVANGDMKYYTLRLTSVGCLIFPLCWVAFQFGAPAATLYIVSGSISFICMFLRLVVLKKLIGFTPLTFIKGMILPAFLVFMPAYSLPYIIRECLEPGFCRLVIVVALSEMSLAISIYVLGLQTAERIRIRTFIQNKLSYIKIKNG